MSIDWSGIQGQASAKEILTQLVNTSRIPHAFLFHGPEGTGKYYTAIRYAQIINTNNLTDQSVAIHNHISNLQEPYIKFIIPLPRGKNETESSGPIEKLNPEDILELKSELQEKIKNPYYKISLNKANIIKINSIREINKFLSLSYSDVKYRCILISDAHLMNEESQNALLKNLEEPPAGVIFILLTPYSNLLRETIRSRCWMINFQPLDNQNIKKILSDYFNVLESVAEEVATFSDGSVTRAFELINNDFKSLKEKTISVMRFSFGGKFHSALNEFGSYLSENDSDSIKLLIKMIISWLNDIQKHKFKLNKYFFDDHLDTLDKFNSKFPDVELNDIIVKLDYLSSIIKNNINLNLIALNIVYELASLTKRINK